MSEPYIDERKAMIALLQSRGIVDKSVLKAMAQTPRHHFVADSFKEAAYADAALPTQLGQTISQPYIVAYMLQVLQLRPTDRVLEVGSGTGYAAAVMSLLVKQIYGIERLPELVTYAKQKFQEVSIRNVKLVEGDGTAGLPPFAPYDVILVSAGAPALPEALKKQLGPNGRLLIPVGGSPNAQHLLLITRTSPRTFKQRRLIPVRFVPLVGEDGWPE